MANHLPRGRLLRSLLLQLGAMLYDWLLIGASAVVITMLIMATMLWFQPVTTSNAFENLNQPMVQGLWYQVLLALMVISYYCFFWHYSGQTPGMRAWKLYLHQKTSKFQHITLHQCMIRLASALLSFICFGGGYFWAIIDKKNRTIPDLISGLVVLNYPVTRKIT